ncbi:MAG: hypothetical protein WCI93_00220 [bacterium]
METKIDSTSSLRTCQNCKADFTIEVDDFNFYQKMKVPAPTFCPECRLIRRLARRNERVFYRATCEKCNKNIITVFSEESKLHIYCGSCWYGDDWDGLSYGFAFDPSKNFLTELDTLLHRVPMINLYGLYTTTVNSDYTNMVSWLKNCYMVTYSDHCENVTYGSFVNNSRDSMDNLMGNQIELCYETINCDKCYQTFYSVDCENCSDVWFSKNCAGSMNCFGCVNLKNKNYHIWNVPYSKEDYEQKIKEFFPLDSEKIKGLIVRAKKLWQNAPQKYIHGWRNVGSSGDYLNDTKNAKQCFVGFNIEDSKFCSFVTGKMTDVYDFVNFGENSTLMYEVLQGGDQTSNIRMSQWTITNCHDIDYSFFCTSSRDLFGCVGLKKRQYCIFNKQYSKEEYFKLREEIIKHMNENPYLDKKGNTYKYGEFFPIETSLSPYNETTAQEFFPLTKEEAIKQGYKWKEKVVRDYDIDIKNGDIPNAIKEVNEFILGKVIECNHATSSWQAHNGVCSEECTEAFKIIPAELQFYQRMNLPLPRLCPNCRHSQRLLERNPLKLWHRKCMKEGCQNEFETSYAPERPEIVFCERCYQNEVY